MMILKSLWTGNPFRIQRLEDTFYLQIENDYPSSEYPFILKFVNTNLLTEEIDIFGEYSHCEQY